MKKTINKIIKYFESENGILTIFTLATIIGTSVFLYNKVDKLKINKGLHEIMYLGLKFFPKSSRPPQKMRKERCLESGRLLARC